MIVANLATYPPRRETLESVIARIAPQVDRLNIVFNQYETVPEAFAAHPVVHAVLPHEDTKDVGKFYVRVAPEDYLFYIDDDVDYPSDYVAKTLQSFRRLPFERALGGYHCSRYYKPRFSLRPAQLRPWAIFHAQPNKIARYRRMTGFQHDLSQPMIVDQVATSSAILRGRDAPSYNYMRTSQKFVDVRLARWCFEQGITPLALPCEANWLHAENDDISIYRTFTSANHGYVANEIRSFAFKRKDLGQSVHLLTADARLGDGAMRGSSVRFP